MAPKKDRRPETWIGVVSALADGERFAVAWVRRRDEWLADLAVAPRGAEIAELARIYREAVDKRGRGPDRLNVDLATSADGLRAALGTVPPIRVGFDTRARALSDAAASAVEIAFDAEGLLAPEGGGYDPDREPDPAGWLALAAPERRREIRLAHMRMGHAESDDRAQMHAAMHEAIETQVAHDDPPETAQTLARLVASGMSRHHALHTVAAAFMRRMQEVAVTDRPFDRAGYAADLRALGRDS